MDDDAFLYRVAYRYYVLEESLEDISKSLEGTHFPGKRGGDPGMSASSLSRAVERARQRKIVEITCRAPHLPKLEEALKKAFRLPAAVVVATPPSPAVNLGVEKDSEAGGAEAGNAYALRRQLGRATADYVLSFLPNGAHLGLCGGRTMACVAQNFRSDRIDTLHVHALAACSYEPVEYAASTVVGLAVLNLKDKPRAKGEIRGYGTLMPLLSSGERGEALQKAREQIATARENCQVIVAGVGGLTRLVDWLGETSELKPQDLRNLNAVGDFLYQLFDDRCVAVACNLNKEIVGLALDELPRMAREGKKIVAVGGGLSKLPALEAMLKCADPFLHCLVTDEATVQALIPGDYI